MNRRRVYILVGLSLALWSGAAIFIRTLPMLLVDPAISPLTFVATLPVAWISVVAIRWAGRLATGDLLTGVAVVGTVAMTIDGLMLRWCPHIYGSDDVAVRAGAAWLLWGYGLSLAAALSMARPERRSS